MLEYSPYQKDIAHLFLQGLDLERLRDKTILVVGATGLVGGCVVDVLMQNPARCYKVIGLVAIRNVPSRSLRLIGKMSLSSLQR